MDASQKECEGSEGVERQDKAKGETNEKQTPQSSQSEEEPSEGRQTREANIQSLPPEICLKIMAYLPDIKFRLSLRRVCSVFRNLIDARVCWKSRNQLRIDIRRNGWWFSVNGCRVNGSLKYFRLFHSCKRIKENVCAGIRAMFRRINIRNIIIVGVDHLTDTDVLLTLAEEMLKHESNKSDRQLRSVKLIGRGRLDQPLLFSIFIPVAAGLTLLNLNLRSLTPEISKGAEDSAYRLIKCCTGLQSFTLWPIFSLRCLEAIRGRPIKGLRLQGLANMGGPVERVYNSLPGTLTGLHIFGPVNAAFLLPNLNNKQQLRAIAMGVYSGPGMDLVNLAIRELAAFPNLNHILFLFQTLVSCENLVSLVTRLFNAFQQQDRIRNRIAQHIFFRVEKGLEVDVTWPQESVKQALEESGIQVAATHTQSVPPCFGWEPRPPLKWIMLRRERMRRGNVSVSLYCNCISK